MNIAQAAALSPGARERILRAAREEFAANGLRAASVRAIGARAGVTAAMLNYYFGSKRALYDQIVEQAQTSLLQRLTAAAQEAERSSLPARLAAAYFDFLVEEHECQQLILREVLDRGESISDFSGRYLAPLRRLLAEQFGLGDEVFQAAVSLFGAVAGYFVYEPVLAEVLGRDPHEAEALARRRQHVVELASVLSQRWLPEAP